MSRTGGTSELSTAVAAVLQPLHRRLPSIPRKSLSNLARLTQLGPACATIRPSARLLAAQPD